MVQQLLNKIHEDVKGLTRDEQRHGWLVNALGHFEKKTGQPRERAIYGLLALVGVYLVIGHFAELVCNLLGFGYPALASLKAIKTKTTEDDTQWLTYWTVFAFFSLVDFAGEKIWGLFPVYWLAKCLFLLWLQAPFTRGASILFETVVDPLLARYGDSFADARSEVMQETMERLRKYQ